MNESAEDVELLAVLLRGRSLVESSFSGNGTMSSMEAVFACTGTKDYRRTDETRREKTGFLHMRKQRRRSAWR